MRTGPGSEAGSVFGSDPPLSSQPEGRGQCLAGSSPEAVRVRVCVFPRNDSRTGSGVWTSFQRRKRAKVDLYIFFCPFCNVRNALHAPSTVNPSKFWFPPTSAPETKAAN